MKTFAVEWSDVFPSIAPFTYNSFDNKDKLQQSYNRYFLDRLLSMFKYNNLPESLPQKYLEMYLLTNGKAGIVRDAQGDLRAIYGEFGGEPDVYFLPKLFYYANPYLDKKIAWNENQSFKIGEDVAVIMNDSTMSGLMPLINRYSALMVENLITARIEVINMRRIADIVAPDDKSKKSAVLYLANVVDGKLGVMATNPLLEGIKTNPVRSGTSGNVPNIIEMQQYLKASFYNEIGLNANWNAKRESINSNESQLNDDQLTPLIDNMLTERKEGIERVNKLFDTNISVEFNSAWKENEKEKDLIMLQMKTAAEGDAAPAEGGTIQEKEDNMKDTEDKKEGEENA